MDQAAMSQAIDKVAKPRSRTKQPWDGIGQSSMSKGLDKAAMTWFMGQSSMSQVIDKATMSRVMGKDKAAMPGHGPPYGENS